MDQIRNQVERFADQAKEMMASPKESGSKEGGGHDSGRSHDSHGRSHEGHEGHPKRGHHHNQ
ncbi:hypothetical protein [Streptomyces albidoflavus]|uniref:hypothetical protein n=1 Tax=Streptomyces albidoflavus TaxID=1886 RepID=UPI0033B92C5B